MKVGLNGTAYDALSSGSRERFLHLFSATAARWPEGEFLVYSPRDVSLAALFPEPVAEERRSPFSSSRPLRRFLGSRRWFRSALREDSVDLFVTDHFPVIGDRTLLTIHDLRYLVLPEAGSFLRRAYFRTRYAGVARRARAVVTVSETIRGEVLDRLGLDPERVHVVRNGVSPAFGPAGAEEIEAFRRRRGWPAEYLLSLGVFERRKNLDLLLRCVASMKSRDAPPLVLAGRGGPEERSLRRLAAGLGLGDRVRFSGYVAEEDLPAAYTGASALLMPSRYEGFGLPVLQAFACGTPVVAARAGALPEVAGDAALLRDPDDEEGWRDAIRQVLSDSGLRRDLARKGVARAAELTWARAAESMERILEALR